MSAIERQWVRAGGGEDYLREFAAHLEAFAAAGVPPGRVQAAVFCAFLPSFDSVLPALLSSSAPFATQLYALSYHAYSLHGGDKPLLPPVNQCGPSPWPRPPPRP